MILNFNKEEIEKLKFLSESSLIDSDWLLDKLKENNEINKVYLVAPNIRDYGEEDIAINFDTNEYCPSRIFINKDKAKKYMDLENKIYQEAWGYSDEKMKELEKGNSLEYIIEEVEISDDVDIIEVVNLHYEFKIMPMNDMNKISTMSKHIQPSLLINKGSSLNKNLEISFSSSKYDEVYLIDLYIEKTNNFTFANLEDDLATVVNEIHYAKTNDLLNKYFNVIKIYPHLHRIILSQEQYLKRTL